MLNEEFEILKQIKKGVEFYKKEHKTLSIDRLLDARDVMACNSYYLSEIVAKYKKQYNDSYFMRKLGIAREKTNLIRAGSKISQATDEATITEENVKNFQEELDNEYIAVQCELLLKSIYQILNAIGGRIRHLEEEKK